MMINASVHTAVVSDMDPDEFHEATEGLGILMPLPTSPKADDAERSSRPLPGSCRLPHRAAYGETPYEEHAPSVPLRRRALLRLGNGRTSAHCRLRSDQTGHL